MLNGQQGAIVYGHELQFLQKASEHLLHWSTGHVMEEINLTTSL